jgi:hypothetical protein
MHPRILSNLVRRPNLVVKVVVHHVGGGDGHSGYGEQCNEWKTKNELHSA